MKTLKDVKAGDQVAVVELIRRDGNWVFKRMETVKRRTPWRYLCPALDVEDTF